MRSFCKGIFLYIVLFITVPDISYCQDWVKTFSSNTYDLFIYAIKEDYDYGLLLCADQGYAMRIGLVIKTDINGNVLWEKKLGNGNHKWAIGGIDITPDGGIILTGACDTLDEQFWDPFIVKLTACGEIQWCHVFHTNQKPDYGIQIKSLPDNSFIFLLKDWGLTPVNNVCLMHLDMNGNIIWEQQYFQNDPLVSSFNVISVSLTPDQKYLVTGTCYRPDSGQTTPSWLWPMMVLADSTGDAVWEVPWGYTLPFGGQVGGEGFQSVRAGNAIYSTISHYFWPECNYAPCLIKTSLSGDPVSYHDLIPNTSFGKASTIARVSDTVFFIGGWYDINSSPTLSVFKTDTLGNIKKEKILNHKDYIPIDAILTHDNKYLITARDLISNKNLFYLWKLNLDLEYDSIYTKPMVYDSLCPYVISSSTLFFHCDLTTGTEEPVLNTEKVRMRVFPNPGNHIIHIGMPACIMKQTNTEHMNVTTIFHQWYNDLDLEVYDLFGKRLDHHTVSPSEKEIDLDVSAWPRGLYYVRLSSGGTVVATEKMMVY